MNIVPLRREHVRQVAALHSTELTGLLRALGRAATRAFYAGSVRSPRMVGFVAIDGDDVKGFVWGSPKPRALKIESIAANALPFMVHAGVNALLRPRAFSYAFEVLNASQDKHDAGAPELTYLAVAPEARRSGIGHQLVDAFSAAMKAAGVASYELSVDRDNIGADAFYRRIGFTNVGTYQEFGVEHRRYRLDLK